MDTSRNVPFQVDGIMLNKKVLSEFRSHFDRALFLLYSENKNDELTSVLDYFRQMTLYNVPHGKFIRGCLVSATYLAFATDNIIGKVSLEDVHLVGWCIELLHSGFLVLDDIVDDSPMRRGRRAWFGKQQDAGMGLIAVNDGVHLMLAAKELLRIAIKSNKDPSNYFKLSELFDRAGYKTCLGQQLDILTPLDGKRSEEQKLFNFQGFSSNRMQAVSQLKTSSYTFYLPIACGMTLAGVDDEELFKKAECIAYKIGEYFQAQDDFLDVFGNNEITGKVGTDISDGKCTWLITEALNSASEEQKLVLRENFGSSKPECQDAVRRIFVELNLPDVFLTYEQDCWSELQRLAGDWNTAKTNGDHKKRSHFSSSWLFRGLINQLFKRNK